MQGAQTESRFRGIGRYSLSIVKAIIRQSKQHEILLALNGCLVDSIEQIRASFDGLLPQENIRVWHGLSPAAHNNPDNKSRRQISELTYEAFLASQNADFIYIASLFEGLDSDAVTSIHRLQKHTPVAVTLFDLIPYINPDPYLENPTVKSWYLEKIEHLQRADLFFAISESSKMEGIDYLNLPVSCTYNISTDADEEFQIIPISAECEQTVRDKYGLSKPFVMYTGGIDHRKNIEGLIRSYAQLPSIIKQSHQLVIVCSVQPSSREDLEFLAQQQGLNAEQFILTGFVSDNDLLILYNICKLFVFPSKHEGFGLPALEAMRCGAPVIGSNCSSLPEVIGWKEALFDPSSDDSITRKLEQGLTDDVFRKQLLQQQNKHAKQFSWDVSGRTALTAMEEWYTQSKKEVKETFDKVNRPKLAYISPLPLARSGIADYSSELLPELAKFYDIEVVVEQEEAVTDIWVKENLTIRSSQWFLKNVNSYQRVLYQFGNSEYHQYMFDLLNKAPGIVVLHDFFLSGVISHQDQTCLKPGSWALALNESHGYQAVCERFSTTNPAEAVWDYPANLPVLQRAQGVIVHSNHSRELASKWYGKNSNDNWSVIPLLRVSAEVLDRSAAKKVLGLQEDDLLICSFGVMGQTKLNHRLLEAWLNSSLSLNPKAYLVFVGLNDAGEYGEKLLNTIKLSTACDRIKITGWTNTETFQQYLAAADIGVQLRSLSRGETSAAVLDCMNYGLATIVNAHGSNADLDPGGVWMLPDEFIGEELISALTTLSMDTKRRNELGACAQEIIQTNHNPKFCANQYFEAIEAYSRNSSNGLAGLIKSIPEYINTSVNLDLISMSLASSFPPKPRLRQLLVDVSSIVHSATRSTIQNKVFSMLTALLKKPPAGFKIQPIYNSQKKPNYLYAHNFTCKLLNIPNNWSSDAPVDAWCGDIFIGLNPYSDIEPLKTIELHKWRDLGVKIWFAIYDLLPITSLNSVKSDREAHFTQWLNTISNFDGVVCTTKALANIYSDWYIRSDIVRTREHQVRDFNLGFNLSNAIPVKKVPSKIARTLKKLRESTSFLLVDTTEQENEYLEVLKAFEILWAKNLNIKLCVVLKISRKIKRKVKHLQRHSEFNKRFFYIESDVFNECFEGIYTASSCVIAASYGLESGGYLTEAAQYKTPIIARNIPIFREIAGDYAFYFESSEATELSNSIEEWLELFEKNKAPLSAKIPWITTQESAEQLISALLEG